MRCWNCDAQLRPGAQICPHCHADQNVAYGDWDQSLPIPVQRPSRDRNRDREDDYDRNVRRSRDDRSGRDDYPPRERRGRDDHDDYTQRVDYSERDAYEQRPSRDARSERESRDEYDDDRGSRGSRDGSRREGSGRASRDDAALAGDDSDEHGARDGRAHRSDRADRQGRNENTRRSRSEERDDYEGRGSRSGRTPEPAAISDDDSREEPAYTDDSRESAAYSDESLEVPAHQSSRASSRSGDRDRRDPRDSRDSRDPSSGRATPPARGRTSGSENRRESADAYSGYEQDRPDRNAAREGGRSGGSSRDSYQSSRGASRDRGLPDPLDDPRAPRPLRTSTPLRDQRDPRDPRSGRSSPGPASMPGGMGASGNPGGGRPRSRADYENYDPGRRDPRDRNLPGPSRGGPSGGRMSSGQGYVSGGGPMGGQGGSSRRSLPGMQGMPDDPWSTPGAVNPGMYGAGGQMGQRRGQPPQAGVATATNATKQAPNRTRMIAVILLVALVLIGVAGAGYHFAPVSVKSKIKHLFGSSTTVSTPTIPAFASYTPGPTPTTLPNDKLNSNANLGYSINYPMDWVLAPVTNTTPSGQTDLLDVYTAPGSVARITIETGTVFTNLTDDEAIQGEVTNAQQIGAQFTPIASATRMQQIGGQSWLRQEYNVTLTKTNTQLHMAILATNHLGHVYVITLTGDASGFAQDDSATFEPMLTSFRFS